MFHVKGKTSLTAGDIGKFTSAFQVINSDHVICSMEKDVELNMELTIGKGRGYVPAEEKHYVLKLQLERLQWTVSSLQFVT